MYLVPANCRGNSMQVYIGKGKKYIQNFFWETSLKTHPEYSQMILK